MNAFPAGSDPSTVMKALVASLNCKSLTFRLLNYICLVMCDVTCTDAVFTTVISYSAGTRVFFCYPFLVACTVILRSTSMRMGSFMVSQNAGRWD